MEISAKGIKFIEQQEGCRLKPYKDIAGIFTIGVGHALGHKLPVKYKNGISQTEADELLHNDLKTAETAVNSLVKVPLTQNQFDSTISLVFNVGIGAFHHSSVLRHLLKGEYQAAADAFKLYRFSGGRESTGLLARRTREANLFMTPDSPA
jgi:lysozyme